jgi:subtilisin family serine protease
VVGLPNGPGAPVSSGASAPTSTGVPTHVVSNQPVNTTPSRFNPPPPPAPPPPARRFEVPPANEQRYLPDEVLLDMGPTASPESLDAVIRRHRLTRLESFRIRLVGTTLYRLRIPDGRAVPAVIAALSLDRTIVSAQPNYVYTLQDDIRPRATADEEEQENSPQYVVSKLRLAEVHRIVTGKYVTVAMIDTGIDTSHPYLAGSVVDSFNALDGDPTPEEHGTAMAGAIVEHGELTGVAPGARLLSVRAFASGATKKAITSAVMQGIDWAVYRQARVINMSFAGPYDGGVESVIKAAYGRNVVLVAAAGNDGPRADPAYPGAFRQVIAVTATDSDDKLFEHANHGRYIALAAPGVDVVAPILESAVKPMNGTSIAAAHVSGVVALLIERNPSLRPEDIRRILMATAFKTDANARADEFGAGRVDAFAAVRSLGPGVVSDSTAMQVR